MAYFAAIFPTVGVAILFYIAFRAIILADRRERRRVAKLEEKEQLKNFRSGETDETTQSGVNHNQ